jgi:hypothetical protein
VSFIGRSLSLLAAIHRKCEQDRSKGAFTALHCTADSQFWCKTPAPRLDLDGLRGEDDAGT